jgi:L-amino acid N-acyltransferase YncA
LIKKKTKKKKSRSAAAKISERAASGPKARVGRASSQRQHLAKRYPRRFKLGEETLELRRLAPAHLDALLVFTRGLSEEDLMFLRFDMTRKEVAQQVIADQARDQRVTVLAFAGDEVVGYGSLSREPMSWTRHLGEIRVIAGTRHRGLGLGAKLAEEVFEISRQLGLRKIVARMPLRQEGARRLFERLGFAAEALLPDWVVDRSGRTHDLLIMGHDVTSLH